MSYPPYPTRSEPDHRLRDAAREAIQQHDTADVLDALAAEFDDRSRFASNERHPARAADYRAAAEIIRTARKVACQ